jgi:hypothetical protein
MGRYLAVHADRGAVRDRLIRPVAAGRMLVLCMTRIKARQAVARTIS